MPAPAADSIFTGSIPQLYNTHLVPLIFEPYAQDLCRRLLEKNPSNVLEIAAGTGVVTRQLAARLPATVEIVATDLNQPMLDHAARIGTARPVQWKQADAMQLPFPDHSFDAIVCQFGAMFFPDRAKAFAEAKRVLRPGGVYLFSVWGRIEENEIINTIAQALDKLYPDNPPRFMQRGPHGYSNKEVITADLESGGFTGAKIETVAMRSHADDARGPVTGYCQGSPMRAEIEAQGPGALQRATDAGTAAVEARFGKGPIEARIQAIVVTVNA